MIHRDFPEPNTPEWTQWKQDCQRETQELIDQEAMWRSTQELIDRAIAGKATQELINRLLAAQAPQELINRVRAGQASRRQITEALIPQPPKIKEQLYKRMRQVLFDAFHGKCAYCEGKFVLDQTGDVEHFRPKGQVLDEDANPVSLKSGSTDSPHPGYYWLAYDWSNLLPSCSKCNRMIKTREGTWIGKGARFPVKGSWASNPGDETQEEPLLIHPVLNDPEKYLLFDEDTGIIAAKNEDQKGTTCIKIFDLNREGLPEARKDVYDNLLARMHEALDAVSLERKDLFSKHMQKIGSFKDGREEYSLAGRAAIRRKYPEFRRALEEFLGVMNIDK